MEGVSLTHQPREIKQVYLSKHTEDASEHWDVTTLGITVETIRSLGGMLRYSCVDKPENHVILQTWIDYLGPALYNPVEWFYRSGRNNRINGHHRMTALAALDFDIIYVYLFVGNPTLHEEEMKELQVNRMMPTVPTVRYPEFV